VSTFTKFEERRRSDQEASPLLYSKWKAVTGALFQEQFRQQERNVLSPSGEEAIRWINSATAPFVQRGIDGAQRQRNLELIVSRASSLAFLLFKQPGSFHFAFSGQSGQLVVFPGLVQTVGDRAEPLSPPRILLKAEEVAGSGR
jgi:hypothetical protein